MKKLASAFVALCLLAASSSADAALTSFLKIKGQKTGEVKGGVTQKGRENRIAVIDYSHEIISPRDAATGLPTGKRQHRPFVIRKELDKSSPVLYSMLVTNENIPEWILDVYAPSPTGQEQLVYTVKLTNASIAGIKQVQPNVRDPETARYAVYEEISFAYQKIEWTWQDGGIRALDDWSSPR